jgi:hypothetical protein
MTTRQQSALRRRFDEWCDVWWSRVERQVPGLQQRDVFAIVERVAQHVPLALRPLERSRLKSIWKAANELVGPAYGLAPDVARQYGIETDLIDTLVRIRNAIDPISPLRKQRSGGERKERINKERKELSAFSVRVLIKRLNVEPTLEADGPFMMLTSAVYNIATGNDFGTTLNKVCREALSLRQERPRQSRTARRR